MIQFLHVTKQLGTRVLLRDAGFSIPPGKRVGVVGPNGAGKTTLFRLITAEESCDGGEVVTPRESRLGYLRQQLRIEGSSETMLEHASGGIPELARIEQRIHALEAAPPTDPAGRQKTLDQIGELQHQFEDLGGYEIQSRAEAALHGLGFQESDFQRPFDTFSGGWQMRGELVRVLVSLPDTLLLDEPSNYLDLPAVEWLQRFLREFKGTLLMISHDRYLLRTLTDTTLEISNGLATLYSGGFDEYLRQREERLRILEAARANQEKKREKTEQFIERFRAKATKAAQVQSRIKQLDKMEEIPEAENTDQSAGIDLPAPPAAGSELVRLENAGLSYDGKTWIFRDLDLSIQRGEKTAVVGYNGMGKTTLLRVLAGTLPPSCGKRVPGHHLVVGYQSQEFADTMPAQKTAYQFVADAAGGHASEKDLRNALGRFGFRGDDVWKPCRILSGGEKIRLAFARIFIRPPNLLLLDEPTTHLDIQGCTALEEALAHYPGTVCLVSHDVTFVRRVATGILAVTHDGVRRYPGGYEYYLEKTGGMSSPSPSAPSPSSGDRKQVRRQRAEEREKQRKASMAVKREVRETEARIEALEKEQTDLTESLYTPNAKIDMAATHRRLYEINLELEEANARWEKAVEQLSD